MTPTRDMTPNFVLWTERAMLDAGFQVNASDGAVIRLAKAIQTAVERERTSAEPSLDDAWQAVEAVLPEGWRMSSIVPTVAFNGRETSNVGWGATAVHGNGIPGRDRCEAHGPTPTAALLALAKALRERQDA